MPGMAAIPRSSRRISRRRAPRRRRMRGSRRPPGHTGSAFLPMKPWGPARPRSCASRRARTRLAARGPEGISSSLRVPHAPERPAGARTPASPAAGRLAGSPLPHWAVPSRVLAGGMRAIGWRGRSGASFRRPSSCARPRRERGERAGPPLLAAFFDQTYARGQGHNANQVRKKVLHPVAGEIQPDPLPRSHVVRHND